MANRVVKKGEARAKAEELAHEIARFPQACMRADRASAYASFDFAHNDALASEFARGAGVLEEAQRGAARFAAGEGRHGKF